MLGLGLRIPGANWGHVFQVPKIAIPLEYFVGFGL